LTATTSTNHFAYVRLNNKDNAHGAGHSSNKITCVPANNSLLFKSSNVMYGNELLVYSRAPDGATDFGDAILTGGDGGFAGGPERSAGGRVLDPLESNHPITLSKNKKCLLVIKAGPNTVTSFTVGEDLDVQ
jgi:hypothetical protein